MLNIAIDTDSFNPCKNPAKDYYYLSGFGLFMKGVGIASTGFMTMLFYLGLAVLVFLFVHFVNEKNAVFFSLANAALLIIKYIAFIFVLYVMRLSEHLTLMTFVRGLPSVLYTFVAALGIYYVVDKIFSMQFMAEKKEEGRRFI